MWLALVLPAAEEGRLPREGDEAIDEVDVDGEGGLVTFFQRVD